MSVENFIKIFIRGVFADFGSLNILRRVTETGFQIDADKMALSANKNEVL